MPLAPNATLPVPVVTSLSLLAVAPSWQVIVPGVENVTLLATVSVPMPLALKLRPLLDQSPGVMDGFVPASVTAPVIVPRPDTFALVALIALLTVTPVNTSTVPAETVMAPVYAGVAPIIIVAWALF